MSWAIVVQTRRGRWSGLVVSWGRYRLMRPARVAPPSLRAIQDASVDAPLLAAALASAGHRLTSRGVTDDAYTHAD